MWWGALAAVVAIGLEVTYRRAECFPLWVIPLSALLSYALYRTVHGGATFMLALILFNVFAIAARTSASILVFHEPLARANLVAFTAMVVAFVAGQVWR